MHADTVPDADTALPRLRLFGTPSLQHAGGALRLTPERRCQMLVVLALADGQWVPRERLWSLLWPAHAANQARANLRTVVHRARELPGVQGLEATEGALRWPVATDLQALESALPAGDAQRAVAAAAAGPALDGLDDPSNAAWTEWLAATRQRLVGSWQSAAWALLPLLPDQASRIALADRLLALDPLDETAMAARLQAELAQGQAARARRLYEAFARRLAEELGVEPARPLRALMSGELPPLTSARPAGDAAAPAAAPALVGRRHEMAEARALLERPDCRLLTLLGPGGIGKSRLARAVAGLEAADQGGPAPAFPGGRFWVDLQDLNEAPALLPRLARLLGIASLREDDALVQVAAALPRDRCLLVLDNAEHLLQLPPAQALVPLLARLLDAQPALCLLLTSRARLAGSVPQAMPLPEWLLPVPGLAVPDADSRDLEAASSFDAVQLFLQRAREADPRFDLHEHLPAVVAIAEAVDGMPLALELAASWVRLMPPAAIADELRGSVDLLQRHPAQTPPPARPQHASMREVLAQSLALLVPAEKDALAAIAVFQDGFTREAARALGRRLALPLLSALRDKSLLAADAQGRFRVHPLVQSAAAGLLAGDAALARECRRAHARHFARHVAAQERHARGEMRRLVAAIDAEYGNVRAAWGQAADPGAPLPRALGELVRALWVYFEVGGRVQEGIALLRPALALLEPLAVRDADAAWALSRLRHGVSMLLHRGGHQAEGLAVAEAGIAAGLQGGDLEVHVGCILNSGSCLLSMGRLHEAHARFGDALALAQAHRDAHCTAWALGNLAVSHQSLGNLDAAVAEGERALAIDRVQGNSYQVAVYLINLATAHHAAGRREQGIACAREAMLHSQSQGLANFALHAGGNLVGMLLAAGRADEARPLLDRCLADARAQGLLQVQVQQWCLLSRMESLAGRPGPALAALRQGLQLALAHGMRFELVFFALRAWAAWLQARGDTTRAAVVLLCAMADPAMPPGDLPFYRGLLDALPLDDAQRARAAAAVPGLDNVLAEIQSATTP
ncbi:MAG: tetratricopeptide repeat protein [Rubrivivax sp.]|nr:tetratricopeptide repeat protein [Rubrivivax sp.]